jgi:hypothetical protein
MEPVSMKKLRILMESARSVRNLAAVLTTAWALSLLAVELVHGQVFQDGMGAIEITGQSPPSSAGAKPSNSRRDQARRSFKPTVGRQAAAKYMSPQRPDQRAEGGGGTDSTEAANGDRAARNPAGTSADHYLALHVGSYLSDNSYKWGIPENQENVGRWNLGVTYRVGEWVNSMDLLMRFDVSRFALNEDSVTKFSFLPIITFPDASSRFPLYFGAGIGLGVFGTQLNGESSLALDYQLLAGARFFNIWDMTGLFVEGGIKNHVHIFSDGQFNGTYITTGLLFTF